MLSARNFLPVLGLLALSGCGFRPLYGGGPHGTAVESRLDEIDVGLIANRQGQLLRQALEAELQRAGAPSYYRYHLKVNYYWSSQALGIQADSSSTRTRYVAHAEWQLAPEGDRGKVIAHGSTQAMDSINNIVNQNFAGTLDQGVLRHEFAKRIAHQIAEQLAIHFRDHPLQD